MLPCCFNSRPNTGLRATKQRNTAGFRQFASAFPVRVGLMRVVDTRYHLGGGGAFATITLGKITFMKGGFLLWNGGRGEMIEGEGDS